MKRLRFRAWHRGIREADLLVGQFFDACHSDWDEVDIAWFERLLEEQDVDILAWATGTATPPADLDGRAMKRMRRLDYLQN